MFSDIIYYLFLIAVAVGYRFAPTSWRSPLLASAGLAFYSYYAHEAVFLLIGLTVFSWFLLFPPGSTKTIQFFKNDTLNHRTIIVIVVAAAILGFFKYSKFVGETVGLHGVNYPYTPLAISFFVFEFIHVAAERRKGTIQSIGFMDYMSFIFFFPTMVAGPIKRYDQFSEYTNAPKATANDVLEGCFRIILGLLKKAVIADNLNTILTDIGDPFKTQNITLLTFAILLYGIRIWLDFSGYSDIAIGSSRFFGIKVPENFLQPYLQRNIAMFWRHWHVSLSSWLTDYVYIPLGGSRLGLPRQIVNLLFVMFVSGVWHGAAWNFIVWGLWHGVLLATHRLWTVFAVPKLPEKLLDSIPVKAVSYLVTMLCVWFGWMLFMWPLSSGVEYLRLLAGGGR